MWLIWKKNFLAILASLLLHALFFALVVSKVSSFETADPVIEVMSISLEKQPFLLKPANYVSSNFATSPVDVRHVNNSSDAIAPQKSHSQKRKKKGEGKTLHKKGSGADDGRFNAEKFSDNSSVSELPPALSGSGHIMPASAGGASSPKPVYPALARKRGQEGTARIRCQVDASGRVISVSLATSSGFRLLDEAALTAVRKWKFKPGNIDGVNVAGSVIVPVQFKLK